jgi:hypothetical protein
MLLNMCGFTINRLTLQAIRLNRDILDVQDRNGNTVLHLLAGDAIRHFNSYRSRYNPELQSDERYTQQFEEIVKAGANLDIKNNKGQTPLRVAIEGVVRTKGIENIKTLVNAKRMSKNTLQEGLRYCYELLEEDDTTYRQHKWEFRWEDIEISRNRIRTVAILLIKAIGVTKKRHETRLNELRTAKKRSVQSRQTLRKMIRKRSQKILALEKLNRSTCFSTIPCHHSFHITCLPDPALRGEPKCPICRTKIISMRRCRTLKAYDV